MPYNPTQPRDPNGKFSSGLMDSLEHQLRAKGNTPIAAHSLAIEIMTKQGTLDPKTGLLTKLGQDREALGRKGRRVDRMASQTGHHQKHIGYKTGRAYVK